MPPDWCGILGAEDRQVPRAGPVAGTAPTAQRADPARAQRARRGRADEQAELFTQAPGCAKGVVGHVQEVPHVGNEHASQTIHRPMTNRLDLSWAQAPSAALTVHQLVAARLASMPTAGLPETDVARVQRWCESRVPERARHQVRVECEVAQRHLTIIERRAPWRGEDGTEWTRFPIARLRYTKTSRTWSLYWRDRNLRFHDYDLLQPSASVEDMLAELERDPTGIFWG